VKNVIDTSLEQQAILAIGWLRKAGRLAAQKTIAAEELPQGLAQTPHEYAQRQYVLAHTAVDGLTRHVAEISDRAAEHIKTCQRQRSEIAALASAGKKTAKAANNEARVLAEKIEAARAAIDLSERLLRILRGQEDMPLPILPLYKYAQVFEGLEGNVAKPDTPSATNADKASVIPFYTKVFNGFLRRTDRSDRIALLIAFLLCLTMVATALYYMFFWGSVELRVTLQDDSCLQVTCINSTRNSILLDVPYAGDELPQGPVTHYGMLLELLDADGNATRPLPLETLWEYKDVPAHLYGPVVIGPMFAAELTLDLKGDAQNAKFTAIRLTLFRAPDKKCKVYEVTPPEEFWNPKSEAVSNSITTE